MGKIIAIANQKGGVGKTTTCVNLTCALTQMKKKILLCDMDPQGNSTSGMGADKNAVGAYELLIGGAEPCDAVQKTPYGDVISGSKQLSGAAIELVEMEEREFVLKNKLSKLRADYDYIFIDCPPSLEMLTLNSLCAADSLIIPVQCEYYALEGLSDLMNTIKLTKRSMNPALAVEGILLTMYVSRSKLCSEVEEEVRKYFGGQVYDTVIPRNVRLSEAPSRGKPCVVYDKLSKGSMSYVKLAKEFVRRSKKA